MPFIFRCLLVGMSIFAASAAQSQSSAEKYPAKPVRIVVPYTPGGATDAVARSIANRLSEKWKQPVMVENRSGASGMIGANSVAKAPADGYTLLLSDSAPFVILPALHPKIPYTSLTDFAPITVIAKQIPVLVVSSKLPVKTVGELVSYLKMHPDRAYASLGDGSYPHVAMEEFQRLSNTKMVHVPYKGTAQVITDMIGGEIQVYLGTLGAFQQHDRAGKVRILAVATDKRQSFNPDIPTVNESGVPGFSINVWFGLAAPAGTPPDILDKIQRDVTEIVKDKAFVEQALAPQALIPDGASRTDFAALMKSDIVRWGQFVKKADIKQ